MISHVDLDGLSVILLGKLLSEKKPELAYNGYISVNYGFEEDEELWKFILEFDIIHMADLSVPEDKYQELLDNCDEVVLFDHHDSSKELSKFDNVNHDNNRCGTQIYFDEYYSTFFSRIPKVISHYVNLVNTYDLWHDQDPLWEEAQNMNRVLFSMMDWSAEDSMDKAISFFASYMIKLNRLKEWKWLESERRSIKVAKYKEDTAYAEAMKNLSIRKDYKGEVFGVSAIGAKISIVCARILIENPYIKYIIIVNSYSSEDGKMSMRTRDEVFECPSVYPFEGHLQAAGGELPEYAPELLADESLCLLYKEDFKEGNPLTKCLQ